MNRKKTHSTLRRILCCMLAVSLLAGSFTASAIAADSKYSSWTESNGTSSFLVVSDSDGSSSKVSVSGVKRVGIDVSVYQGDIDWEEVADAGISFAIIRCGYGSNYESQDDKYFLANVEGALAAGIDIGIYLYSYATKTSGSVSAESEAAHVLRLLEEAGLEPEDLALPVFLDMEDSTQKSLGASKLGDIAETFCSIIEQEGYMVGIYASLSWWNNYLTDDFFDSESLYKWVARWPGTTSIKTSGVDDAALWQFTSHGYVSGISGRVDVSFDYLGEDGYSPYVPQQMTITAVSRTSKNTSATVSWETLDSASGYLIYRALSGGDYELVKTITNSSKSSWTDTSLSSGATYSYKIGAYTVSSRGNYYYGDLSDAVSITMRPDTVTLSSIASGSGYISIFWKKVSNASGYAIYRSENGGSYSRVKTITSGSTVSWRDTSISSGVAYSYKIKAYSSSGSSNLYSSSYSNVKTVVVKPSKVTISSASATTAGYVTVKWSKLSNCTGYVIYRSTDSGSYTKVKTISSNSTVSWTDTTVKPGHIYKYKIKAYKTYSGTTAYSSSYSSVKSVTALPAKPTIKSLASSSTKTFTVKCNSVSGATGYQIAYKTSGGSWTYKKVSSYSATVSGLKKNTKYYVKVRAYTTYNGTTVYSSWSSQKSVTVK